ncbi:MAG: sel1 repeat family protein [Lachnospiraceae bacterium]|nr:sel1 repeat family protein [Lachnospiraceae bacterium]
MKKRIVALVLVSGMLFTTACGGSTATQATVQEEQQTAATEPVAETEAKMQDDSEGQALLDEGKAWFYAENGVQDYEKAKELLTEAAEHNAPDAYYYLGQIDESNYAFEDAKADYEKGADQGSGLASYGLGQIYRQGLGVDMDFDKAKECFDKALDAGCVEANKGYGDLYRHGLDTDMDGAEAISYYEKAVDGDEKGIVVSAYKMLADIYENFNGVQDIERDYEKAISYYEKADELAKTWGKPQSASIADIYEKMGNEEKQKEYQQKYVDDLKAFVDAGNENSNAEVNYAFALTQGYTTDASPSDGWTILQKDAEAGNPYAMEQIGSIYIGNGEKMASARAEMGIAEDPAAGLEWFEKAAEAGFPRAYNDLGMMYYYGLGVDQNYETAREWYEKAANEGVAQSCDYIGTMWRDGKIRRDPVEEAAELKNLVESDPMFMGEDITVPEGMVYTDVEDWENAMAWFTKAANMGSSHDAKQAGDYYALRYNPEIFGREDYFFGLVESNTDASDTLTSSKMVYEYIPEGETIASEARSWYEKAISMGDTSALTTLGILNYYLGNEEEAEKWLAKAVDAGEENAESWLQSIQQTRSAQEEKEKEKAEKEDEANNGRRVGESEEDYAKRTGNAN